MLICFQKIVYGKGQSQIISRLLGTFEVPTATVGTTETTDLQKSIFNAPPSSIPGRPADTNGLKPSDGALSKSAQTLKRPRDEEDEEKEDDAGDAPMEEDDESDAPMDASSEED